MNEFKGIINKIESYSLLNLVTIMIDTKPLIAVTLQLNKEFKEGGGVSAFFKETEVLLTEDINHIIGAENIIKSKIVSIKKGGFFSKIILDSGYGIFSVLLTNFSLQKNTLTKGKPVFAVIKATEISLGSI